MIKADYGPTKDGMRFAVARGRYDVTLQKSVRFDLMTFLSFNRWVIDPDVEAAFIAYQRALLDETAGTSRFRDIMLNQNYRWMTALGERLIPILLREIVDDPSPTWLNLLHDVARCDPVSIEDRGNFAKATETWLAWGLSEGYLSDNRNRPLQSRTLAEAVSTLN